MKLEGITPLLTHEEVAQRLYRDGDTPRLLSRERIRQIEAAALRKLREGFCNRGYTLDDLPD